MQVNKPSVIFIDEIDALATRYGVMISGFELILDNIFNSFSKFRE